MRPPRILEVAAAALLLSTLSGCLWAPELDRVRKDIERQLPGATFKREVTLSLGPLSLAVARAVVGLTPDAREAAAYLQDLRDVTIAVYEVENIPRDVRVRLPDDLKRHLARDDWELAVKTREEGQFAWILCKTEDDTIRGVYVVVLNHDNLVLVRARGRLEELVKRAIRERAHIADHV